MQSADDVIKGLECGVLLAKLHFVGLAEEIHLKKLMAAYSPFILKGTLVLKCSIIICGGREVRK